MMSFHPVIQSLLESQRGRPALSAGSPADARALLAQARVALGPSQQMSRVRELHVPTRRDSPLPARLLIPLGDLRGLIVYVHGGGWAVGAIDDFDTLARELAHRSGCAVLLPEYRLAPEHPFPAGLEDIEDVLIWSGDSVHELTGAPLPIFGVGDSAGANLVTVALRRMGTKTPVAAQVLIYPVTNSNFETHSYRAWSEGLPLTRRDMQWFFGHYVGEESYEDPDVAPLRAKDLTGLPPTVVLVAEADVLRDDGVAYAEQLTNAGVPTTLHEYPGVTHGFLRLHNHLDVAQHAIDDITAAIISEIE